MDCLVTKRNGSIEPFDSRKISEAVRKAFKALSVQDKGQCNDIAQAVQDKIVSSTISVNDIQDLVEYTLMEQGYFAVAKAYVIYRHTRDKIRISNDPLMATLHDMTIHSAEDVDLMRENANIDADTPMGLMLKYGSETAKTFYERYLIPPHIAHAHESGDIHIHDLDFYNITTTCTQIDLKKLFKGGFSTGHGYLREPQSIQSYASLACIAIQSNQNDQHGGQSIPKFDYDMAPGVAKTMVKNVVKALRANGFSEDIITSVKRELDFKIAETDHIISETKRILNSYCTLKSDVDRIYKVALSWTDNDTYQAMEGVVHNLNTMHSRAGAQVPFSSLNYGTDTSPEGRMVIRNLLLAEEAGLGDGETPIFPIHIFKLKSGVSYNETDPNYDLFKLACRVSAKRLFPNFTNLDAPFNAQFLRKLPDGTDDPNSEVATMGCVQKDEVITYKIGKFLCVESISRAFDKLASFNPVLSFGESKYIDLTSLPVRIYDSNEGKFVKVKKIIRNPNKNNWKLLKFSNGRNIVLTEDHPLPILGKGRIKVKDLEIGDKLNSVITQYNENYISVSPYWAWLLGLILCDATYDGTICISIGLDELSIYERIKKCCAYLGFTSTLIEQDRGQAGHYYDVRINTGEQKAYVKVLTDMFGGVKKNDRHIPNEVFSWDSNAKLAFLAGMFDADGHVNLKRTKKLIYSLDLGTTNRELAIQQMLLMQCFGGVCKCYRNHYKSRNAGAVRYKIEARFDEDFNKKFRKYVSCDKKKELLIYPYLPIAKDPSICTLVEINTWVEHDFSYDVETESDRFDVSGLQSHNCRTRVMGNVYDPEREVTCGRGNLSFTSVNLPRLGLKHRDDIEGFFEELDEKIDLVFEQMLHRFSLQREKCVYNFPFLMGQNVWLDSDKLSRSDKLGDILKHGTLTIGFIGIAECLKALIGVHHGESEEAQQLGLRIVKHFRDRANAKSQEMKMNFTVIATPAEGLSGTFVRKDKKLFGEIEGITDRDYYTNSFHIPVYYPISAYRKIQLEAPYHALCNGGHITYIEVDGDPLKNVDAFMEIVKWMHDANIGYGSINHPVDRDPVCGYTGVIDEVCPRCGRRDGEPITVEQYEAIRRKYTKCGQCCDTNEAEEQDKVSHYSV